LFNVGEKENSLLLSLHSYIIFKITFLTTGFHRGISAESFLSN